MDRLTGRDTEGTYFVTPIGNALYAEELRAATVQVLLDRLAYYEDAEENGELVRVVRCDGCVYHIDNGNHYCRKLRIDCPLSDFYCAFGAER